MAEIPLHPVDLCQKHTCGNLTKHLQLAYLVKLKNLQSRLFGKCQVLRGDRRAVSSEAVFSFLSDRIGRQKKLILGQGHYGICKTIFHIKISHGRKDDILFLYSVLSGDADKTFW